MNIPGEEMSKAKDVEGAVASSNDMVTLIMGDGQTCATYKFCQQEAFAEKLKEEMGGTPVEVVFDCHGVLDTVSPDLQLFENPEKYKSHVCCSYVGRFSHLRAVAQKDIMSRIKSRQIKFGVLIFERGKAAHLNRYTLSVLGSKAWFCDLVQAKTFVDDGVDHVASVLHKNSATNVVLIRSGVQYKEKEIRENEKALKAVLTRAVIFPSFSDYCASFNVQKKAGTIEKMFPSIGFGTMEYVDGKYSEDPAAVMTAATTTALNAGFRKFDCAEIYESTVHVGKAFGDAIGSGKVTRESLHITTKLKGLPCEGYQALKDRVKQHLAQLSMEYVNLLLIHWPGPGTADLSGESLAKECTWEFFDVNIDSAWKNMQRLKMDGLCREIGVSNFYSQHLQRLALATNVAPFANQIFIDMTHQEEDLVKEMLQGGIVPIAYRPTAFLPVMEMAAAMGDRTWGTIAEAAAAGEVSPHEFVMKWMLSRGISPLVKSNNEDHCKANT